VRVLTRSPLVDVDPEVAAATTAVARRLEEAGHAVDEAPLMDGDVDEFLPIMARMVGQIPLVLGMARRMQPSTLWLHGVGRAVSRQACLAAGERLGRQVLGWFGDADIAVTPTVGLLPPRVGAFAGLGGEATFRAAAKLGAFTAPFNVSGQPAISIPAARSRTGLPIGVQLVGRPGADRTLLALAEALTR